MPTKERIPSIIGLKELRLHTQKYITEVGKGRSFTVMRRSKPVFSITPTDDDDDDANWETVIDFTKFRKGGIEAGELLKILKNLRRHA